MNMATESTRRKKYLSIVIAVMLMALVPFVMAQDPPGPQRTAYSNLILDINEEIKQELLGMFKDDPGEEAGIKGLYDKFLKEEIGYKDKTWLQFLADNKPNTTIDPNTIPQNETQNNETGFLDNLSDQFSGPMPWILGILSLIGGGFFLKYRIKKSDREKPPEDDEPTDEENDDPNLNPFLEDIQDTDRQLKIWSDEHDGLEATLEERYNKAHEEMLELVKKEAALNKAYLAYEAENLKQLVGYLAALRVPMEMKDFIEGFKKSGQKPERYLASMMVERKSQAHVRLYRFLMKVQETEKEDPKEVLRAYNGKRVSRLTRRHRWKKDKAIRVMEHEIPEAMRNAKINIEALKKKRSEQMVNYTRAGGTPGDVSNAEVERANKSIVKIDERLKEERFQDKKVKEEVKKEIEKVVAEATPEKVDKKALEKKIEDADILSETNDK